jgi:hypothetical protein
LNVLFFLQKVKAIRAVFRYFLDGKPARGIRGRDYRFGLTGVIGGILRTDGLQGGKQGRGNQQDGEYYGHFGVYHHKVVYPMNDSGGNETENAPERSLPESEYGNAYPAPAGAVEGGRGKGPQQGNAQVGGAVGRGLDYGESQSGQETRRGTEIFRGKGRRLYKAVKKQAQDDKAHEAARFFGKRNLHHQPEEQRPQVKIAERGEEALEKARDKKGQGAAQKTAKKQEEIDRIPDKAEPDENADYRQRGDRNQEQNNPHFMYTIAQFRQFDIVFSISVFVLFLGIFNFWPVFGLGKITPMGYNHCHKLIQGKFNWQM